MSNKTQSQLIKNQGSALRRTATAVRNLAASTISAAHRQKLLDAAAIIEAEAKTLMTRAKQRLAEEVRYEQDFRKAKPLAMELVKTLPMETTAQKLALMAEAYLERYMIERIADRYFYGYTPESMMQREVADALNEIAGHLAHASARSGTPPEIPARLLANLQVYAKRGDIVAAADAFDSLPADAKVAA